MRRVAVTGVGLITPIGSTTKDLFGNLMAGKSGIGRMSFNSSEHLSVKIAAVPPTAHLRVCDPECDLDYVANGCRTGVKVGTVMSNSFAFGGTNAVLVRRKCD